MCYFLSDVTVINEFEQNVSTEFPVFDITIKNFAIRKFINFSMHYTTARCIFFKIRYCTKLEYIYSMYTMRKLSRYVSLTLSLYLVIHFFTLLRFNILRTIFM